MSENFSLEESAIKFATKSPKTIENSQILASKALEMIENFKIQLLAVTDENGTPIGTVHIHDLKNIGL